MSLKELLNEALESRTVFTVFGIGIDESTVVTWIIMAVVALLCFILTRGLKLEHISKRQAAVEFAVTKLQSLTQDIAGEHGVRYAPYLITMLIYLFFANIIGVFGFKPPTKSLNVTASLALMSIILVQYAAIREKSLKGWLKSFGRPTKLILPFNILDLITRPLSLCMRLFGNILGAFVIMEILKAVVPVVLPAVFSLYFDFFDGILQAYVFVFLTGIYIKEAIE